jgi:hypothetical protein
MKNRQWMLSHWLARNTYMNPEIFVLSKVFMHGTMETVDIHLCLTIIHTVHIQQWSTPSIKNCLKPLSSIFRVDYCQAQVDVHCLHGTMHEHFAFTYTLPLADKWNSVPKFSFIILNRLWLLKTTKFNIWPENNILSFKLHENYSSSVQHKYLRIHEEKKHKM